MELIMQDYLEELLEEQYVDYDDDDGEDFSDL